MFGGGITFAILLITLIISIKFGFLYGVLMFAGLKWITK